MAHSLQIDGADQGTVLDLEVRGRVFRFVHVCLEFSTRSIQNVFSEKNNKTLAETLTHRRYQNLAKQLSDPYTAHLQTPLGQFLTHLKQSGDESYKRFLNPYGDRIYCTFHLTPTTLTKRKGLYAFTSAGKLVYIGRSRDPFLKRFNQGYGKIHPKNCFLDGQATNCHLNSRIAENADNVRLYLCPLDSNEEIICFEQALIQKYTPEWNLIGGRQVRPTGFSASVDKE